MLTLINPGGIVDGGQFGDEIVAHLSVVLTDVSLQGRRSVSGQTVTVHPLSYAQGGHQHRCQDGTAGDASEAVLGQSAGELHLSGALDGVDGQAMNGGAVLTDADHGSFRLVDGISLQGQGGGSGRPRPPCRLSLKAAAGLLRCLLAPRLAALNQSTIRGAHPLDCRATAAHAGHHQMGATGGNGGQAGHGHRACSDGGIEFGAGHLVCFN